MPNLKKAIQQSSLTFQTLRTKRQKVPKIPKPKCRNPLAPRATTTTTRNVGSHLSARTARHPPTLPPVQKMTGAKTDPQRLVVQRMRNVGGKRLIGGEVEVGPRDAPMGNRHL